MQFYQGGGGTALVLLWNWNGTQIVTTQESCDRRRRLADTSSAIGMLGSFLSSFFFFLPSCALLNRLSMAQRMVACSTG